MAGTRPRAAGKDLGSPSSPKLLDLDLNIDLGPSLMCFTRGKMGESEGQVKERKRVKCYATLRMRVGGL